jgi:cytochrome c-type biogenesis protein CcmE
MNSVRKKRLLMILFILMGVGAAIAFVLYALQQNLNLYYPPSKIVLGEAPIGPTIRVGGMVVKGSVKREPHSLAVQFLLTDFNKTVAVHYTGILPDLFREGQGIVAMGHIDKNHVITATQVLAKHDEKYMPPEVAASLQKNNKMGAV